MPQHGGAEQPSHTLVASGGTQHDAHQCRRDPSDTPANERHDEREQEVQDGASGPRTEIAHAGSEQRRLPVEQWAEMHQRAIERRA